MALAGIGLTAGMVVLGVILAQADWRGIAASFGTLGWGMAAVFLFRLANTGLDAAGWNALIPAVSGGRVFLARWIGESVNALLPALQVGGDLVRARLARGFGAPWPVAGASVMVDFTVGLVTQFLFTILGVVALAAVRPLGDLGLALGLSGLALGALLAAFYLVQRRGLFARMMRFARGSLGDDGWAAPFDDAVAALYGERKRLFLCGGWRMASWLAHAGEVWLLLFLLGQPAGIFACLAIESLSYAARSAAFMVPGAVGIQEGGVVAIGLLVGLDLETALTLALAKRARELALGLPGLAAWLLVERQGLRRILGFGGGR